MYTLSTVSNNKTLKVKTIYLKYGAVFEIWPDSYGTLFLHTKHAGSR